MRLYSFEECRSRKLYFEWCENFVVKISRLLVVYLTKTVNLATVVCPMIIYSCMRDLGQVMGVDKGKISVVVASGLLLGALSFVFFIVTQKHFKASSDILIVQNQSGFSDYYALSKSAEYLTNVLIESVYSEKFLDEVKSSNMVRSQFLPEDKLERLREWEKMVRITRRPNLGIVRVEVLGDNQRQVTDISNAVLQVMTTKYNLFLGKGQDIEVRPLSGPIWQKNPSGLEIFLASAGGFAVGALAAMMVLYYRGEKYAVMKADQFTSDISIQDFKNYNV